MPREAAAGGHLLYLWGIVFVYFSVTAIALSAVSRTAGLDQAEQLLLSQTLQPGYSAQPPLYTYLVKAVFFVTGPGLAPLLLLKAVLLSLFVGLLMALGREFGFTARQHLVAVAGIVFIPQFIWESQRDLTHSVLVTTVAAATLLQLARTRRITTVLNYALLGGFIGLGLISKYNYAVFLAALLLAALLTPGYRPVLANRRMLAVLLVALLVTTPHVYWLASNLDIATGSVRKLHINDGNLAAGLAYAAVSALAFLAPLLIFSMILVARPLKPASRENTGPGGGRLLLNLLLATTGIVAIFIMLSGTYNIKDRWYQPLLFYAPLIPALFTTPSRARLNWYLGLAAGFALLVSTVLVARTTLAGVLNRFSYPNIPYPELIAAAGDATRTPAFILAESKLLGGNARPVFPDAVVQVPGYSIDTGPLSGDGLVLCETPACADATFREWLGHNYAIDVHTLEFERLEMPCHYAPAKLESIYFSRVRLPRAVNR